MRRLTKTGEPEPLVTNRDAWRKEFEDWLALNGGSAVGAPTRYRHKAIRNALRRELHDKCAYCESIITHVSTGHIEHILPKARRPDLVVTWNNLTLACPTCNQCKGDYFDPDAPLLHPYDDDPVAEIDFIGPMARADGHEAGYRTIQKCQLNRHELVLRRLSALERAEQLIRQASSLPDPTAQAFVLSEVHALAEDAAEYTSTLRRYLAMVLNDSHSPTT